MGQPSLDKKEIEYIIRVLRRGTIAWMGRNECLKRYSKKVLVRRSKKGKSIYKTHWQCAVCTEWFADKGMIEVDHIVEIGSPDFSTAEAIGTYLLKMYCRQSNLQTLCNVCHQRKTSGHNASTRYRRKSEEIEYDL
jgi:5-methylcytosine-specific restriction endonuclease McrA